MPIYEYHCSECGHDFELMQKIYDRPIKKCEKCGRLKAKRIISQTSFILKGSGWYVTDYNGKKSTEKSASSGNDSLSEGSEKKDISQKADTETTSKETPAKKKDSDAKKKQ